MPAEVASQLLAMPTAGDHSQTGGTLMALDSQPSCHNNRTRRGLRASLLSSVWRIGQKPAPVTRINPAAGRRAGIVLVSLALTSILSCAAPHQAMPVSAAAATPDPLVEEMVAMINTEVDPAFVYAYENTKFVPPDGKTLLIMGQTVESITEYTDSFAEQPGPAGWAAYWGIPSMQGVDEISSNETGSSQHHQMLVDRFPALAMLQPVKHLT